MVKMKEGQKWQELSKPDPELVQMIQERFNGNMPEFPGFPDVHKMRALMQEAKRAMTRQHGGGIIEAVKEQDYQVTMRDGFHITCRSYTPDSDAPEGRAVYIVLHGGGFCLGDLGNEELLCRLLCKRLDVVCINVEYRLAPEHPFPKAPHDCFDVTKWVIENAASLKINPSKGFVLNGTSAGGNLAVTVCHQWHDANLQPPITGCHTMCPLFVDSAHVPERARQHYNSWSNLADAPILNHKYHDLFIGHYIPESAKRGDPLFSVMRKEEGVKILPGRMYFQVCGMDPVRDEALIFEEWCKEEDKKTMLRVYPGLPHGFWSVFPSLEGSKKFFEDAVEGARWLLNKNDDGNDL